jgi:hypothetical protein
METPSTPAKVGDEKNERGRTGFPDVNDVIAEWFSQEYPDRLRHECWWKDHSQYREYHKSV